MSFSINEFRAQGMTKGGARPSQFHVQITPPFATTNSSKIVVHCHAASIPGLETGEVSIPYFGREIYAGGDRTFEPWSVSVLNDEDFDVRAIFERWNTAINSLEGNLRTPLQSLAQNDGVTRNGVTSGDPIEGYKTIAEVTQMGKTGNVLRSYQMIGCWPRVVEPIRLDWEAKNQIEVFGVVFRYDYWLPNVENTLDKVIVDQG